MATAKHDVPREVKEAQIIERRRALEAARQERIFDVKNRTIGIDTAALEAQIAAKKQVAALEAERERALDAAMIATAQQADILQQEVDRMKSGQMKDLAAYRSANQQKTGRREYDLSDPDALKKDTIPTVRFCAHCCAIAAPLTRVSWVSLVALGVRACAGWRGRRGSLARPRALLPAMHAPPPCAAAQPAARPPAGMLTAAAVGMLQANPENLGLSSAQLFPGMDSTNDERKVLQAQQMREWCSALIEEKTGK
eukprot:SAG22_NODE_5602_length_986_cov_1.068771_1_plen_253_part_01